MKNNAEPVDFVELYLNNRFIQLIVDETNQYATNHMIKNPEQANNSFVGMWRPVDCKEMKTFLGFFILTDILRKPSIKIYWSIEELISTLVFSRIMTRDQFRLIQKFLHFSDNSDPDYDPSDENRNRLHKVALFWIYLEKYSRKRTILVVTLVCMSHLSCIKEDSSSNNTSKLNVVVSA